MTYISAQVTQNRQNVIVWERDANGNRDYRMFRAPYYFYVKNEDGDYRDIYGNKLARVDCSSHKEMWELREALNNQGIRLYESDIGPEYKILSQHYFNKSSGKLNITFYDIEVDYDKNVGYSTVANPYAPISSVALYHEYNGTFVIYVVPPSLEWANSEIPKEVSDIAEVVLCKNEAELLRYLLAEIENTDILSGWNSDWFDAPYIYQRLLRVLGQEQANLLSFRDAKPPKIKEVERFKRVQFTLEISGRISLDFMEVFKKLHQEPMPGYSLEVVSEEILPHIKKMDYDGSLHDLYRNNFWKFVRYNIRDTEILKGLEEKLKYIQFSVNFSHAATGLANNILGTIKLTELAIINYCHYEMDRIVPDSDKNAQDNGKYMGAFVLNPQVGMPDWGSAIDIKSLYPSTMRSLNISPEAIVGQFVENNRAYEAFRDNTDRELVMYYENGFSEAYPPINWKKIFKEKNWCISGFGTVFTQDTDGVITSILTDWFNKRIAYQKQIGQLREKLKDLNNQSPEYQSMEEEIDYLDKMQYILKIRLNSIYGCMGNPHFKFYDVRMAESVTRSGREVLMHMVRQSAEILDGAYEWPSESCLYSDTDSLYFRTHTDNEQDALKVAKQLTTMVNDSFAPFMMRNFLCDEPHSNLIKAEQEIVFRRAIFVAKKMYVMRLANKDGKSVDKIKIVGHKIKKTVLPKKVKQRLIPYIEMIMNGIEWLEIGKALVSYRDELKNSSNLFDIGLPQGIKQVEMYTDNYNNDKTTRLPGHIAASIFYNECLDQYHDLGTPRITTGMKIKVFNLKKKFGRFKSIALPADIREFPEWFINDFSHLVDREAQVARLIDQTMKNILVAIGKRMPTKKSLLVDEMVEY